MKYSVESGIEMNDPINVKKMDECPFPFSEMSVGDSFYIKGNLRELNRNRSLMQSWIKRFRKNVNKNFSVATRAGDDGFRVWRIS